MFDFNSALKLIGVRAIFILLSIFFLVAFTWLLELPYGLVIYSALISILYFGWVYGDAYRLSGKDKRAKRCTNAFKGFVTGLISEVPSLLVLTLLLLMAQSNFRAFNIAYILWQAPFVGFLVPGGAVLTATGWNFMYFVILLFIPVANGVGYLFGLKKISLSAKYGEKLLYKKEDHKKL